MKIQNESISVDEFRLRLNKIQLEEESILEKSFKNEDCFVFDLDSFPITINTITSGVYFIFHLLWSLQYLTFYEAMLVSHVQSSHNFITIVFQNVINSTILFGNVMNAVLLFFSILTILFHTKHEDSGVLYIFGYVGFNLFPYLRFIIIFGFYSSSFYILNGQITQIVIFFFHALLCLFKAIFLQNITIKKDQFHCQAYEFLLSFKIVLIISLTINLIFLPFKQIHSIIILSTLQLMMAICVVLIYFHYGINIYRGQVTKTVFIFSSFSFLAMSISIFIDSINVFMTNESKILIYFIIFLIGCNYAGYQNIDYRRRISGQPQNNNLRQKIFFLFNKLEGCDMNQVDDCYVKGTIFYHTIRQCLNPLCIANIKECYDAKKKKNCSITKINSSKDSLIKFYVKCLFEKEIEKYPLNIDLKIDFIQFRYIQLKNQYYALMEIYSLQQKFILSIQQKIRLKRLIKLIKQDSSKICDQLYLHQLSMENIIHAQTIFLKIQKLIQIFLKRTHLFWKYLSRTDVSLRDILHTIKPNLVLSDRIGEDWTKIAHFFDINIRWKLYFICFTIYIKNQKLKPSEIQDFGNSVQFQSIFKPQNYFIDKTTQRQSLFNSIMLFQQNTCFLHASCDQDKMIITRVSKMFKRNFQFKESQIINQSLNILMPPSIQKFHHKKFLKWIKEGRNTNEQYYPIKKIYPLTKTGFLNPCFKFYKCYLNLSGNMQYIAMFKRNRQDQMLLITNQYFQIEAITYGLSQKLRMESQDIDSLKGLNILAMIPMLVKYTKYGKNLTQDDEDFLQNEDNKYYLQAQTQMTGKSYATNGNCKKQLIEDILTLKKSINLTNFRLFFPKQLLDIKLQYQKILQSKGLCLDVIKQVYKMVRKVKALSKCRGEMCIRQKTENESKYYQIQITQLEQNNRLQKLSQDSEHLIQVDEESSHVIKSVIDDNLDLYDFFQLNQKKNRIVLLPSNNIFLKQQHNKALTEIRHINNIINIIRIILVFFLLVLIVSLVLEFIYSLDYLVFNDDLAVISTNQKLLFLVNSQANIRQIPINNPILHSFFMINYNRDVMNFVQNSQFPKLVNNQDIYSSGSYQPYYKTSLPFPLLGSITFPNLDSVTLFKTIYEKMIELRYMVMENYDKNTSFLDISSFYIYNNYIFILYQKIQTVKETILNKIFTTIALLEIIINIFALFQIIIFLVCFIFSISQVIKVTQGFSQLLSIFIQMQDKQIRKIQIFAESTEDLFIKLNAYNESISKYSDNQSYIKRTETISKAPTISEDYSAQIQKTVNLNKKIKKMNFGEQIKKIKISLLIKVITFFILFGSLVLFPYLYSTLTIKNVKQIQNAGQLLLGNNSVVNVVINGLIEKFRNSSIYSFQKYKKYIEVNSQINHQKLSLVIANSNSDFGPYYKSVLYDNFCGKNTEVIKSQLIQFGVSCLEFPNKTCDIIQQQLTLQYFQNQCSTIFENILVKGLANYYNFINEHAQNFFFNSTSSSVEQVQEIVDLQNIITIFQMDLYNKWKSIADDIIQSRLTYLLIITISVIFIVIILHFSLIEVLTKRELKTNYEVFRRMYEMLIPEFVINKEKIIKAKLIKQGFMQE